METLLRIYEDDHGVRGALIYDGLDPVPAGVLSNGAKYHCETAVRYTEETEWRAVEI